VGKKNIMTFNQALHRAPEIKKTIKENKGEVTAVVHPFYGLMKHEVFSEDSANYVKKLMKVLREHKVVFLFREKISKVITTEDKRLMQRRKTIKHILDHLGPTKNKIIIVDTLKNNPVIWTKDLDPIHRAGADATTEKEVLMDIVHTGSPSLKALAALEENTANLADLYQHNWMYDRNKKMFFGFFDECGVETVKVGGEQAELTPFNILQWPPHAQNVVVKPKLEQGIEFPHPNRCLGYFMKMLMCALPDIKLKVMKRLLF